MKKTKFNIKEIKYFILLWITQSLSTLGSSMTSFALIVWSYELEGSALSTALLSVCSYTPYVLASIFVGAISDKMNKKAIMLISDTFAAICTLIVLYLIINGKLELWHLYILNGLNGLMNSFQQPAFDVTISLITPKKYYQKTSGMRIFTNSLNSILTPIIATTILTFTSINIIILIDLGTFVIAAITLIFFIKIPKSYISEKKKESIIKLTLDGMRYLKDNRGVLDLILFLAAINFTASMFNATLPALLLSEKVTNTNAYGLVNMISGIAMLIGSIIVILLPTPKSRVKMICNTLLLSMSTENFFLAFGNNVPIWCIGAFLGWITIPIMSSNMDVLLRNYIPLNIQGRVYSARNSLQYFTIPIGYILGGILVDKIFEPLMASMDKSSLLCYIFGSVKGSGAAFLFFFLGILGVITCIVFRIDKNIWHLEKTIEDRKSQ